MQGAAASPPEVVASLASLLGGLEPGNAAFASCQNRPLLLVLPSPAGLVACSKIQLSKSHLSVTLDKITCSLCEAKKAGVRVKCAYPFQLIHILPLVRSFTSLLIPGHAPHLHAVSACRPRATPCAPAQLQAATSSLSPAATTACSLQKSAFR